MKAIRVAAALFAGVVAISPNLQGQSTAKPSPYSGVSQPPPDDTITVEDAAPATTAPVKLVTRTVATPAPAMVSAAVALQSNNPDDGIVGDSQPTSVPTVAAPKPLPSADPDADIVTFVPTRAGELPEGTTIRMALNQELSTNDSQSGTDFTGRVAADVMSSGRVVIPQGSEVLGKVVRVTEGHRFGNSATIRLRPDVVVLPDGSRYVLRAQVVDTNGKSRIDGEGTLKPNSRLKTNVIKEGAGIGTGAVAGALVGGPPGALVGTLIGAGVMTTNILVQHPASLRVPKDSTLTLSLTKPMLITPAAQIN